MAMATTVLLCEALVLSVAIIHLLNGGIVEGRSITKEEYLQMKEHLKFLNRSAVKIIETAYGDIFYCVDIYKQPSLDHPLLKNHIVQMRPSTYPEGMKIDGASSSSAINIALKNGSCPLGTVPIRRTQMKEIVRATSLSKFGEKVDPNQQNHHYAFGQMRNGQYFGTQATLNVWNPRILGGNNRQKFSLSQIWIVQGPGRPLETIEVGWMVYPRLFGDFRTRLFTFWTTDYYNQTGCYNLLCPGFVQVSPQIPLGIVIEPTSIYDGRQSEITLSVFKDRRTGDWWLTWGPNTQSILIGYWPKRLFKYLNVHATKVLWGGEVYGEPPVPQMGSGHFPSEGVGKAAYVDHVKIIDQSHAVRDVDLIHETTNFVDKPSCAVAYPITKVPTGNLLLFGGPGGNC